MDVTHPAPAYEDIALNPKFRDAKGVLLHALLQSTDYGVLVSGLDRQDIIANRRLGELFRMPPQQVVETEPDAVRAYALSRVRNPQKFEALLRQAYADPDLSFTDEIELAEEPVVTLRRYTGPIYGPDGSAVGRLWTFLDITETKRLQAEVQAQLTARTTEYLETAAVLQAMNALCPLPLEYLTTEDLLRAIVDQVRHLDHADCAAALLLSADGKELHGVAAAAGRHARPLHLLLRQHAVLRDVVANRRHYYGHKKGIAKHLNCPSAVVVPLIGEEQVIGIFVLGINSAGPEAAEPDRLRAAHLSALADQIGVTLRTHRLQSDVRSALETLQMTQRKMVEMEKLRTAGILAASVAHDIRNILTALQMEVEMQPPPVAAPIMEQLNRFSALTHRLLAFSRNSVLETRPTSIADVLRRIVPLISGQAQINAVETILDLPATLPPVSADANQLEHLFVNLCLNGIQAMAEHGGILRITVHAAGQWLEIKVEDTGCGIPPDVIGRLFDPFFTTRATGTGLGLFSCKRIAEEHGGQITVHSQPECGTCFTVLLPGMVIAERRECE